MGHPKGSIGTSMRTTRLNKKPQEKYKPVEKALQIAKHDGSCIFCSKPFKAGEKIWQLLKKQKQIHFLCIDEYNRQKT